MRRRLAAGVVALSLLAAACNNDLGLGLPDCTDISQPSVALVLMAQAVPTAAYGPCVEEMKLGWDGLEYEVETGRAAFDISREGMDFLTVELTPRCDVGDARQVESDHPGVTKYEDVQAVGSDVLVTIVPSSERSLIYARSLVSDHVLAEVSGRRVVFRIDDDMTQPILARSNRAMLGGNLVLIVTDLDVEDETVELRTSEAASVMRLELDDALDEIERIVPEIDYRGRWMLEFEGGCITYRFDASGQVADGLAEDAMSAIGLYDLAAMRALGARLGFPIEAPPER